MPAIKAFTVNRVAVLVFSLYLVIGVLAVDDYGISIDEEFQHLSALTSYTYVMGDVMRASGNEAVREAAANAPDLMTYHDRYYGVALETVTIAIEHLRGFSMSSREIYVMRHLFVFLNYFASSVFFYLILRRRYGHTWTPLIGALMYILYPRFFGESFYNIKDMLFFAWLVISAYFVMRWLEDGKALFLIVSAFTLAVTTNTRILGLSLLLLACLFSLVRSLRRGEPAPRVILKPALLIVLTFVCYIGVTPFVWQDPIRNTYAIFRNFLHFGGWDGTHFYLGEMITSEVPWHYIPVWMGVTIPLLYIALFIAGACFFCAAALGRLRTRTPGPHLYDLFFTVLFFCTIIGFIALRINMYEGWRHSYCLFFPFLYVAVFGLDRVYESLRGMRTALRRGFACAVCLCLCAQAAWIAVNHPYEYVYFNLIGKQVAEKNFTLDYWEVSHIDLIKYILESDGSPTIRICGSVFSEQKNRNMLTEGENARLDWTGIGDAEYYIQDTRMAYEDRKAPKGFAELKAVTVDGMKIAILYKRI